MSVDLTIARQTWPFFVPPDNKDGARWIAAPTYEDALAQARIRGWVAIESHGAQHPLFGVAATADALAVQAAMIDVVFP